MSESQSGVAGNAENQQQFAMQKIYVKDLSFETPNSPEVFTQEWKPDVNVELDTKGKQIAEDVHEVVLGITVTVKMDDKVAYLVEIHQANIRGNHFYNGETMLLVHDFYEFVAGRK